MCPISGTSHALGKALAGLQFALNGEKADGLVPVNRETCRKKVFAKSLAFPQKCPLRRRCWRPINVALVLQITSTGESGLALAVLQATD